MQYSPEIIEKLLADIENEIKIANKEVSKLPTGTISFVSINNEPHIMRVQTINNVRRRTIIDKDEDLIISLIRKSYLNDKAKLLTEKQKWIRYANKGPACNEADLYRKLFDKYPKADSKYLLAAINTRNKVISQWESEPYEKGAGHEEHLTQPTNWGEMVRSKDEAIIGSALHNAGIPFRYEQVINLADYRTPDSFDDAFPVHRNNIFNKRRPDSRSAAEKLVPDFTILRADGKLFYWEHCGMMEQEEYYSRWIRKLELYRSIGIVPWDNLIITYDNPSGNIDIREVEFIIQTRLAV